jgi:glycosyltransferase involved in cell wall biosynthesis
VGHRESTVEAVIETASAVEQRSAVNHSLDEAAPRLRTVIQVTWSLVAGGAEMYALTIASQLDARRYRSILCAVDQGGALEGEIERLGIPYFILHRRPGLQWSLIWQLYRLFCRLKVDVVQTHHFNQLFYSALGARLAGARLIHTEHSVEVYKRRRLRIALRYLARLCDQVIAIGNDGARALREEVGIPARKLTVIRAGVEPDRFNGSKSEARGALELEEADRVVTIMARLFPEKNHRLLLAAFAEVMRHVERARLLIVGEGIERDNIQAEVERLGLGKHVQMLGVRRDVARILAASDVCTLSSDREGLPIAVLEAMAAGKPVVATAVGDLPLVVQDQTTGRLVPPQDQAALASALIELLNDPHRAAAMGANARQLVTQHYNLRAMIDQYTALYSQS